MLQNGNKDRQTAFTAGARGKTNGTIKSIIQKSKGRSGAKPHKFLLQVIWLTPRLPLLYRLPGPSLLLICSHSSRPCKQEALEAVGISPSTRPHESSHRECRRGCQPERNLSH